MNNKLLTGLVALALMLSGLAFFKPRVVEVVRELGSVAGPDVYSYLNVQGVFTQAGGITATSTTQTSATLLFAEIDDENVVDMTPNTGNLTLTLPASTTFPLSERVGSHRTIWIRNATTTAATQITIAGGTGTLLKVASSSPSAARIYGDTDGGNHARLDFVRKANSDIEVFFQGFLD